MYGIINLHHDNVEKITCKKCCARFWFSIFSSFERARLVYGFCLERDLGAIKEQEEIVEKVE